MMKILHAVLVLSVLLACEGYKILIWFPVPSNSHAILGRGVANPLLNAGHQVTLLTTHPGPPHPNLTQTNISYVLDLRTEQSDKANLKYLIKDPNIINPRMLFAQLNNMTRVMLEDENLKKMLLEEKFDGIIVEWFFNEVLTGLGAILDAPVMLLGTTDLHDHVLELVESIPSPAVSLDMIRAEVPPHSFFGRINSLFFTMLVEGYMKLVHYPEAQDIYHKLMVPLGIKRGKTMPSYEEARRNISMLFYNNYPSTGVALSVPPNVKGVGGFHIDPDTKPLPDDLQKLMDESKDGVIYFSMGSILQSEDLTKEMKTNLIKMFGTLKQTVLWKFTEKMDDMPPNVHIRKWLPQQSILAHPNLRVFITHGGLLSMTECLHFGTPFIGLPIFGDQFINMLKAEKRGFAKTVFIANETFPINLLEAIHEVIGNPSYKNEIQHLSKLHHDRPVSPTYELLFWVEHVIRTKGALHLRSVTKDVPVYQKLYLDFIALLILIGFLLRYFIKKRCCKGSNVNVTKKKKKN